MNLSQTLDLQAGGPGSGCNGPNCGRPAGPGHLENHTKYSKIDVHINDEKMETKLTKEWAKQYPKEDFDPFSSGMGSAAVVRDSKGKLAAGAGFAYSEEDKAEGIFIGEMRSHQPGAGRELLAKLQEYAAKNQIKSISLETDKYDVETLVKSLGFKKGPEGGVGYVYKWKVPKK